MIKTLSFRREVVSEIGNWPRWICEFSEWVTRGNRRVLETVRYVVSDLGDLQPQSSDERWECVIHPDPVFISEDGFRNIYAAYPISCLPTAIHTLPFELVRNERSGEEQWQAEDTEGDTFFVYVVPRNAVVKPQSDEPVSFRVKRQISGTSRSRRQVFLVDILKGSGGQVARAA